MLPSYKTDAVTILSVVLIRIIQIWAKAGMWQINVSAIYFSFLNFLFKGKNSMSLLTVNFGYLSFDCKIDQQQPKVDHDVLLNRLTRASL